MQLSNDDFPLLQIIQQLENGRHQCSWAVDCHGGLCSNCATASFQPDCFMPLTVLNAGKTTTVQTEECLPAGKNKKNIFIYLSLSKYESFEKVLPLAIRKICTRLYALGTQSTLSL